MQQAFEEEIRKQKLNRLNPMAALHIRLCKAVDGWVPLDEFLEMPFLNVMELIQVDEEVRKEMEKEMRKCRATSRHTG